MKTAILAYIRPTPCSTLTHSFLMPVCGVPIVAHLFKRLKAGLKLDAAYYVLFHDDHLAGPLSQALAPMGVSVLRAQRFTPLDVLREFCCVTEAETILRFQADAVFPDCDLAHRMVRAHFDQQCDATYEEVFPDGLAPEIYEANAICRLADATLATELDLDCLPLMKLANQLLSGAEDFRFRLLRYHEKNPEPRPDALPATLLVTSKSQCFACERVMSRSDPDSYGATHAAALKREILLQKGRHPVRARVAEAKLEAAGRVLYTSYVSGFSGAEQCWYELICGIKAKGVTPTVLLPCTSILSEKIERAGIPVNVVYENFTRVTPSNVNFFADMLMKDHIDLVHTNGFAGVPLLMAAWSLGVPLVIHLRTLDVSPLQDYCEFAARIITVSDAVRLDVLRSDVIPDRVTTVYDGLDLQAIQRYHKTKRALRRNSGIPGDAKVIAMVARIAESKKQDLLLSALPRVVDSFPNTVLLFAGEVYDSEHKYYGHLCSMIRARGLENRVRFLGFTTDILDIYAMADVLVVCNEREAFPHCILEAQAMGLPIVAPSAGGNVELVSHLENGMLFDPNDSGDLEESFIKLFSDQRLYSRLSASSRQRVRTFDLDRHVDGVLDVYRGVMGSTCESF